MDPLLVRRVIRGAGAIAFAGAALVLISCGGGGGGGGGSTTGPGTTNTGGTTSNAVTVAASSYTPASVTVNAGTTVTWTWNTCDSDYYGTKTCVTHNVTFNDGPASASQETGSYNRTFANAGTYPYHCTIHGAAAMSGEVMVK